MTTIIPEDGSGLPTSNSYVSIEEFTKYAEDRGINVPTEDDAKSILLIKAMDYIEIKMARAVGIPAYATQALMFPRSIRNQVQVIPATLKKAQMIVAIAAMTTDLFPFKASNAQTATSKKVGPLSIAYRGGQPNPSNPVVPEADILLSRLVGIGAGQLNVVRG